MPRRKELRREVYSDAARSCLLLSRHLNFPGRNFRFWLPVCSQYIIRCQLLILRIADFFLFFSGSPLDLCQARRESLGSALLEEFPNQRLLRGCTSCLMLTAWVVAPHVE